MYRTWGVCWLSLTHFCPGRRACLLPLVWDIMPSCGLIDWRFLACGWTSGFSTVYTVMISIAICNLTTSVTAIHRDPFYSYGSQWLNDSTSIGCFLAGVWGLPRSCASRSGQLSHCDAGVCLKDWNKCVGPLSLVTTAFEHWFVRGPMPQNQATNETVPF